MTPQELIEKYGKEVETDTQIDATNVLDKQYSAPNTKHKWLYRLIQSKRLLAEQVKQKEDILNDTFENNNPAKLSKAVIKTKVDNSKEVKKLNDDIIQQQLLVDYLFGVVNIYSQIGFDFKNLVELIKMEQL